MTRRLISGALIPAALLLALPLVLGACKQDTPRDAYASGEILPGSISDAMLPEDRLTSQPPLAPQAARPGKAAATAAAAEATTAPDAAVPAEPAPKPAAEQASD